MRKSVEIRAFPFLIITFAGIILTAPALIYGIPFFSDDAVTHHAVWYVHFSDQLLSGDLYPRWLMGMNRGLGSPIFFYYPPVPFFIASLFKPFFPGDVHGWHQLGVSASLALIASGFCASLWLKEVTDKSSALIASILYMATPYHLASDLYIRGALAEYWAFVWMPLILFFSHKITKGDKLAVAGLAISYALLVMTHLPTTLIFSILPICYAIFLSDTGRKLKTAGITSGAMALGAGLSAIYLWPAMTMQQFVFLDRMTTGYFSYKNWLFFSNLSLWWDEKLPVLLLLIDLTVITCCAFIITRSNPDKLTRRLNAFWFIAAMASVLMMTDVSRPVWLIFPALQKIQFPWRFNAILSVATTALLAFSISSLRKWEGTLANKICKAVALLFIIGWIPATDWAIWQAYPFNNQNQEDANYKYKEIAQDREVPEYYPRWNRAMAEFDWQNSVDEDAWDSQLNEKYESLWKRVGESEGRLSKVKIVEGTGQVDINSWQRGEILLHVNAVTDMRLYVSQFYFPNWTAHLVGESSVLNVQPSLPDGLISLSVPSGDHQIQLRFGKSRAETTGELISLISIVITLAYIATVLSRRSTGYDK